MKKSPDPVCLQTAFKNEWERQGREGTSSAEQRWEKETPVCVTRQRWKQNKPEAPFNQGSNWCGLRRLSLNQLQTRIFCHCYWPDFEHFYQLHVLIAC